MTDPQPPTDNATYLGATYLGAAASVIVGMTLLSMVRKHCQLDCEKPQCSPKCQLHLIAKKFGDDAAKTQTTTPQESPVTITDDQDIILGHNPLKSP